MKGKRKVSAQTRVKLSQAAKRRKRGPKGSVYAGKFMAGALPAFQGMKFNVKYGRTPGGEDDFGQPLREGPKRKSKDVPGQQGTTPSHTREVASQVHPSNARQVRRDPDRAAERLTYYQTQRITGSEKVPPSVGRQQPVSRPSSAAMKKIDTEYKETHWRESGTYASGTKKTPAKFLKEDVAESHRQEIDKLLGDPNSEFNRGVGQGTAGSRNRVRMYTDRVQEGYSHDEALAYAGSREERRGRKPTTTRGRKKKTPVRKSKFESSVPTDKEFGEFGITADTWDDSGSLRERFPEISDRKIVQVQQEQRQGLFDEMEKNVAWTHETRRAQLMGEQDKMGIQGRKNKEDDDRVVFFTTSMGGPAPSVPADSLVGQYIIRRRKKMLEDVKVPKAQLRGEFPMAVRDMHILEFSTGLSYGVEGKHGVYQETGWRKGSKTSKGYNKPVPRGSHILYDSQGTPLYDSQGRVRYSEGNTRAFRYDSPRAGLKIFIG